MYEKVVNEFTQSDILDGKLFYRHVGPHRSDFVLDRIYLHLEDDAEPPNESDIQEFIVKVNNGFCERRRYGWKREWERGRRR